MSLKRLVYYSAVIGGWSAFVGWLISEVLLSQGQTGGRLRVVLTCAMAGAAIGGGLNLVAGMANAQWKQQVKRLGPGLIAGGIGGAVGGFVGDILYTTLGLPRALGWMIMGAGIGVVEGFSERSPAKLRNGLIGGMVGGLIGGLLFDPILTLFPTKSDMSSGATAFVVLGICIGILIGLVKVVLKDAWLTVLDGYRSGRQLILSDAQTVLGRAEYAALPFMGRGDGDVDMEHARIIRQPDGGFVIEDNQSRQGTRVNNMRVNGRVSLHDGDVIRIGTNSIRFSERHRRAESVVVTPPTSAPTSKPPTPSTLPAPRVSDPQAKPMTGAAVAPPPLTVSASRPAAPVAPTAPASSTGSVPEGSNLCPSCRKPVPKQQRYCIRCDLYF